MQCENFDKKIKKAISKPKTETEKNLLKNLKQTLQEQLQNKTDQENNTQQTLANIKKIFNLQKLPKTWNAFDNSHISGFHCNGAMICWQDGIFIKNNYRRYNFKAQKNGDDYSMMKEMVYRRLQEIQKDNSQQPDILLIDGGIGQGTVVLEAMKEANFYIPFICISKGEDRIDGNEKYYLNGKEEVPIPKNSQERLIMQKIRDEVHRFAITNTRKKIAKFS
ncbi:MAG: hypothetical protein RL208_648 [Pseudomonadota bacterium]|jgi:excinuclease ABC subunit C